MAQHVLELVMQLKTGEVTVGLDQVESQVNRMVENLTQFSNALGSATLVNPQSVESIAEINEALKITDRFTGQVTDRNIAAYEANMKYLEAARQSGQEMRAHGKEVENLTALEARRERLQGSIESYYDNVDKIIVNQADLMNDIRNDAVDWQKVTAEQQKDVEKLMKHFKIIDDAGVSIEDKFGITSEHYEKMKDFSKESEKYSAKTVDHAKELRSVLADLSTLVPGLAQFAMLATPVKLLANELMELNKVYEDNHQMNALLVNDLQNTDNVLVGLNKTIKDAASGPFVLISEATKSLSAILQTGQARVLDTAEELKSLTESVAMNARATGISEETLASLSLRLRGLTGDLAAGNKLMDAFVVSMHESGVSSAQMNKIAGVLDNNLIRINKAYAVYDKQGKKVVSGSEAIVNVMGSMAKAAADAGADVDTVMAMMTKAIEQPMSMIALLGPAISSTNFGEQMLIMGERAEMFADQMSTMAPSIQAVFAQSLGTTPKELNEMAKASRKQREEIEKLAQTMGLQAAKEEYALRIQREKAEADKAAELRAAALEPAIRQMSEAWDQIRIIFGRLAMAMQPILDGIAWLLNLPVVPWVLAISASLFGLYVILKKIGIIKLVGKWFGKAGKEMGEAAKQGGGGKGLKQLGESIRDFLKALSEVSVKEAAKVALTLVMIGGALAVGVGAIGYAANALPPDKAIQLTATLSALVGAMYVLSLFKEISGQAIPALGLLIAIGAGLAIGLALIGLAADYLPSDKAVDMAIILGSILGAMVILTIMSQVGAMSLMGAVILAAVGAALALGLYLMGAAATALTMDQALSMLFVIGVMLAVAGICAALGLVGPLALVGALVLALVGAVLAGAIAVIGLAMNLVPADGVDRAMGLIAMVGAMAMLAFLAPLAMIGSVLLAAAAIPFAFAVLLLAGTSYMAAKAGKGIQILVNSLKGLTPAMGTAMANLGEGLLDFALALASGAIMEFLGGDMVGTATRMGAALKTLADPIRQMTEIKGAGEVLSKLGKGLDELATGLDQDAFFGLIKKDFIGVATRLGGALTKLAKPLNSIDKTGADGLVDIGRGLDYVATALHESSYVGEGLEITANRLGKSLRILTDPIKELAQIGPESAEAFLILAKGLDVMEDQFSKGGVFEFFTGDKVENATKLAKAMSEVAGPLAEVQKAGGAAFAKGLAEELKTGLAVDIQRMEDAGPDPVVEKLEEIRMAIVETSNQETVDKLASVLDKISNLSPASGRFGGMSSADNSYV